MIDFNFIDVEVPGLNPELFVLWLQDTIEEEGFKCGDVSYVFCTDDYLLSVNQRYLNHDYYTDIITFDYSVFPLISGDLFLSIDRIIDNSNLLNTPYEQELRRVCVHGVLHLCGYKDKSEEDEKLMRSKEDYYLDKYVSRETLN